ncbi:N-acetylglucosamine-6-phosphate deacetylase [Parvularcula sp. ZS-1/3]|uniref:N-acetylglucosamine-6-phosphate deacetylase n=1 Tax=Parvularcula mediterranea TaxID=2732508 RepID=A0A7Y3RII3_9PROT|nr:N-acetylglucosamine-6-phosphate deacetylase [Parvularcula mediterranea]NNU14719.1 N-acetylglucosamine-6-phosphate deacetylase [Parvularcula mediterranea]
MTQSRLALIGADILLRDGSLKDHALILSGGVIDAIAELRDVPSDIETVDLGGLTIAPGFIDLQVNGGGGVLFNDAPTKDSAVAIAEAHRPYGTTSLLPTLISDTTAKIEAARGAIDEALGEGMPGIIGLHLEGPFLAPEKRGIHDDRHFLPLTEDFASGLTAPKGGSLMVTLAPECTTPGAIAALTRNGAIVSAGHTVADYETTRAAISSGVTSFTHLFNAMPQMVSRQPGPIAAALESGAWCGLIADGHHVSDAMLRLAIRAKSDGCCYFVTDAMSTVGSDSKSFSLGEKTIREDAGKLTDDAGTLAGSALTMIDAVRHGCQRLGLSLHDAVRMASTEPARLLGIDHQRGLLAPGRRADLVLLDHDLSIVSVLLAEEMDKIRLVVR